MKVIVCAADVEDKKLASFVSRSFSSLQPELLLDSAFSRVCKKKAAGALVYFDSSLGDKRILELAAKLGEVESCAWGVIDRTGSLPDPASFFFAGACDYVGPSLFKSGLDACRLDEALVYGALAEEPDEDCEEEAVAFPGWDALKEGEEAQVRFCYAAIGNQKSLLERIGEKRLGKLKEDFAAFLEPWSKECGGIVWIKESLGCLLLFPPRDEGMNPVLASFRLLLDRALIGYEVFKLEVPLTFRFAFHSGHTSWQKPGSTGKIVSEDVNFVFHLGMKAAGDGYILVSGEAAGAVPPTLSDLFAPAGDFEGRSLIASQRFRD
jgi:hypothetical protein